LRPGTLPHHRTYGFPYPAVGPGGHDFAPQALMILPSVLRASLSVGSFAKLRLAVAGEGPLRFHRFCPPPLPFRSPCGEGPRGPRLRMTSRLSFESLLELCSLVLRPFAPAALPAFLATTASADFRFALTKRLSPGKALILSLHTVRLYLARLGWISGFTLARTLAARTRPHCRFVFLRSKICSPLPSACPRQLRHRVGPCGSLRLPPSVPAGSFHPAIQPRINQGTLG